jgi:hypothetical protein
MDSFDVGLQRLRDPVDELIHDSRERLLLQLGRTRRNVDHPESGFDLHQLRQVVCPPAGVNVAGHAGLGQCRDQLPHVDVHAPAVTGTRLDQRRRMQR